MIESLYSEFEHDITITAGKRKTFDESEVNWEALNRCHGISSLSKGLEEVVVLRHEKKWVNASLLGVENHFLKTIKINKHIVLGKPLFKTKESTSFGIIGVELMQKLNTSIGEKEFEEQIFIYAPKRNAKIQFGKNPFYSDRITLS
jgi:lipoprotein-releasing system permease protein